MHPIKKRPEPFGLKLFKKESKGKIWPSKHYGPYDEFGGWKFENENGKAFDQLRVQLLAEQFHLCAYCGQFIPAIKKPSGVDLMKTEHYEPQNGEIENDLNYHNLLGACLGGQEFKNFPKHCDSSKKDTPLKHIPNPAKITVRDTRIRYKIKQKEREVLVVSTDSNLALEIKVVLNLNEQRLASRRFFAWDLKIRKVLGAEKEWTIAKLTQLRKEYSLPINGQNIEFKDFILWYLDEEIKRHRR